MDIDLWHRPKSKTIRGYAEENNLPIARKILREGHIYILLPDGKEYTIDGMRVK